MTRKFFRSFMKPVDPDKAKIIVKRLRILYLTFGVLSFSTALILYNSKKGEFDDALSMFNEY